MRLDEYIAARRRQHGVLLMTHLIVGYPSLAANRAMLAAMAAADVDLVELQMPFSEPIADGPLFARANQQALEQHTTLDRYFELLTESAAQHSFQHLLMGYYNTAYRMGTEAFCQRLAQAGAAGFILPDLPLEEYGELREHSAAQDLAPILLMTPTSSPARLAQIGGQAQGFVYAVARKGVTGRRSALGGGVFEFLATCRQHTQLPVGVGFGLAAGDDLRALQGHAEIGIVGSALLTAWEERGEAGYRALLRELAAARD